jgi:hypothetical protein
MIVLFGLLWSILYTGMFNNTEGSLLLVATLHGSEIWLVYFMMSMVIFHGLTPPFDKKGSRMHYMLIVGPARQPDRSFYRFPMPQFLPLEVMDA